MAAPSTLVQGTLFDAVKLPVALALRAIDGLAVALGVGVMTLSQVPANARLGGLVVLSIGGCFLATVILLPALLRIFKPACRPA